MLVAFLYAGASNQAFAQDLEPRRWTPLPPGLNVAGAGYAATRGDVFFDPVLLVEDAELDGHMLGVSYVRSFNIAQKSARIDVTVPWQNLEWTGLLDGEPATASRVGLADPWVRLSMILVNRGSGEPGSPGTVVGVALAMGLPLGEYLEGRLLNVGGNRFVVRTQVGIVHTRGKWAYELTGSAFLYDDNDEFLVNSTLEQDPLYATQGHIIRFFDKPGWWAALSAGYAWDGETRVDGVRSDNPKRLFLSAVSVGFPVGQRQGLKVTYLRSRTKTDRDADTDSLALAFSHRF
ncbi:MAG: transporter [Woeseiaceae bacterium]|nr:transporter [Woeseiaceae bacterium]NIP19699.1 transporter [Woeseiaceae bacterium]NIS89816.1 transporter [Woeseiaceae bacterium]